MKFIVDNWMLISIAFLSGSMLLWPVLQGAATVGVSPTAAVQLMNRERATVVDLSDTEAFAQGHIVGSRNIPLAELEAKLGVMVKNKGLPLILVCPMGTHSAKAVVTAKRLGYEQAQSLAGGMKAWRAASLPVERV